MDTLAAITPTSFSARAAAWLALGACAFLPFSASAQSVTTVPVGAMSYSLASGSLAVPSTTLVTLPLYDYTGPLSGISSGVINSYSGLVITVSSAGWTTNALSVPSAPFMLQITSGTAEGRFYSIVSNTNNTITLSGPDLQSEGVVAGVDTFRILSVDTLNTLFGSTTLQGGASSVVSDIVYLFEGGGWAGYYYNTTLGYWRKTSGPNQNKDNIVLRPDTGFLIQRKYSSLNLVITGTVPTVKSKVTVLNSGSTLIATGFPAGFKFSDLAIQNNLANWSKNPVFTQADVVSVFTGGSWVSYYHNNTFWRRSSGPVSHQDGTTIPAGAPIILTKRGFTAGTSSLVINEPYDL